MTPVTETFKGSVSSAFGTEIPEIPYEYQAVQFNAIDDVRTANKFPDDDEILAVVNAKEKAGARAKQTAIELERASKAFLADVANAGKVNPYVKPDQNSEPVMRANMVKTIMKLNGLSEEIALQIVNAAIAAGKAAKS